MEKQEKPLYSLIPLEDFKAVLGIDDREDKIGRFCLVTASYSIEQYCKRRFMRKKYFERIEFTGDLFIPLREFPVSRVIAVYAKRIAGNELAMSSEELLEPEFYQVIPDCGADVDMPFSIALSPALKRYKGLCAIRAVYWAGYAKGRVPADLSSACMELAAWNMNRYRSRRIGMTGNVRGSGRDGEHFEMSMPENVRRLLEPYRRKVI
jgi:hypothetical protein